jgi:hypothetical protein
LIESVDATAQTLGLYLRPHEVAVHFADMMGEDEDEPSTDGSLYERLRSGEARAMMTLSFNVGEVAWSERIQNQEAFEEKKEFEKIVPSEDEIWLDKLREEARNGKLLDLGSGDEDDEG